MDKHLCEFCISNSTLYYFFSTVAQVLAATAALSVIILQFKINEIKRFLIGSGHAMFRSMARGERYYDKLEPHKRNRLEDAIGREDINGIEEILNLLTKYEIDDGIKLKDHPTGFQGLNERYKNQKILITTLNKLMRAPIIFSLITIIACLIGLSFVDLINKNLISSITSILLVLFLVIFSLWKTYKAITRGLD